MKKILKPEFRNQCRVSIIISILMAIIPIFKGLFLMGLVVFSLCLSFSFLFFSSFKIVLSDDYLKFYQLFLPLGRIKLNTIRGIRYVARAKSGQLCALEIRMINKKLKAYPVRLFKEEELDDLILSVRKLNKLAQKDGFCDNSSVFFS